MNNYIQQSFFILGGMIITLKYSLISIMFGLTLGIILAIFKVCSKKYLVIFANIYTSIFRGTPLIIQLSIVYFGLPSLIGIKLSAFSAGVIAFSLNSAAYVSEIFRAGINGVDKGQIDAAKVLGVPYFLIIKDIIFPQSLKIIFPSLVSELINLIKESALISIIGEMDLMRRAQVVALQNYSYFLPMMIAAMYYYLLVLIITYLSKIFEKKLLT